MVKEAKSPAKPSSASHDKQQHYHLRATQAFKAKRKKTTFMYKCRFIHNFQI